MALAAKKDRQDESNLSSNDDPSSGFIRFEVDNVSDLTDTGVYSPVIEVHRLPWKLWLKYGEDKSFLRVYLYHRKSETDIWSVDVSVEFSLINVGGGENINKTYAKTFNHEILNWGFPEFYPWEDVLNEEKGFIKDNKIIIEARFTLSKFIGIRTISPIDYSDPNVPSHDIIFLIDGEKIHANKGILSVHSPVFSAMFYGQFAEKDKKEIELKDVDSKAFIDMLNLIYPSYEKKISLSNCESILKLADQFQINVVIDEAEKFLTVSSDFNAVKKLHLSDQYRLANLQDHCLGNVKSVKDVSDLKKTDGYKELSDKVKALLLEKVLNSSQAN